MISNTTPRILIWAVVSANRAITSSIRIRRPPARMPQTTSAISDTKTASRVNRVDAVAASRENSSDKAMIAPKSPSVAPAITNWPS